LSRPARTESLAAAPAAGPILAVLPRGEAIRNFVYSGALQELSESALVAILSVMPSERYRQALEADFAQVFELQETFDAWPVRFAREILETAHGHFLDSEAARVRAELRDREARGAIRRAKRFGKKLIAGPFSNRRGVALLERAECALSERAAGTLAACRFLREVRPALVFNGSHVHSQPAVHVLHAARRLGIPTATFIFSWDNLTSQGRILPPADAYLVWNEAIRHQLLEIYDGVRPEQVFVTGTPQFDFHLRRDLYWSRQEFCDRVGADPNRPIVLYSTGTANHMPGEPRLVEQLADVLASLDDLGPPQLLVRVYAKDRTGRFECLRRRSDILMPPVDWNPRWYTPEPGDAPMFTNTLRHSAVGVNVASTISLELCLFDKPVINIGYNPPGVTAFPDFIRYYDFDHYRPVALSGAVDLVRSESGLALAVREALTHPEARSAKRRALVQRFFEGRYDGRCGSRVAQCLLSLASAGGVRP
jgi:hypothetical protein